MSVAVEEADAIFDVRLPPRPYPGLRPFETYEWPIFFGRERMADAVVGQLIGKRLLVVHGDSGSGKSSLVRAAVLPRLEQENARGGIRWRTCTALPRLSPCWNLAQALACLDGETGDDERAIEIRRLLNAGRDAPALLAQHLRRDAEDHVCILIDQFEELFDHARQNGPDEAQLLANMLIGLFEERPEGLYAVLTMRSEFLGACAHFKGFAETVNATQYLLPRMEHADLLRAIREPALLYDGEVTAELAERLIADSGGGQDQLPLIQHGLMLLHAAATDAAAGPASSSQPGLVEAQGSRRPAPGPSWRLGLASYRNDRGLTGLLSDHADAVAREAQARVTSAGGQPRAVEDMFRALTSINADGQAIRRPRTLAQLAAATGTGEAALRHAVDAFRADGVSFLRPYGSGLIDGATLIDISHEALIRCWREIAEPRRGWLAREFRNGLVWQALLVQADSFEKHPDSVLGPVTTDEREGWLKRRNPAWAERYGGGWDRVQRLIAASATARDRDRAEAEEVIRLQQQGQLREQRLRLLKWGSGVMAVLLLAAIALGVTAYYQSERAKAESLNAYNEAARAEQERQAAEAARQQAEAIAQEARQAAAALQGQVRELQRAAERVVDESPAGADLQRSLQTAKDELAYQVNNLSNIANKAPPPPLPVARIYIQITQAEQRPVARELELRIENIPDGRQNLVVPGIEQVNTRLSRSVLRCFRADECRDDGPRLVEAINALLLEPQLVLEDVSARYGTATNIRPRHFELWFAPGAITLR